MIPAERLQEVLDRAAANILDSAAPGILQAMLLRPTVNNSSAASANVGSSGVEFMRFWQGWQELHSRLSETSSEADEAPVVAELSIFRDALVRCSHTRGGLSPRWLATAVSAARGMSADESAW